MGPFHIGRASVVLPCWPWHDSAPARRWVSTINVARQCTCSQRCQEDRAVLCCAVLAAPIKNAPTERGNVLGVLGTERIVHWPISAVEEWQFFSHCGHREGFRSVNIEAGYKCLQMTVLD